MSDVFTESGKHLVGGATGIPKPDAPEVEPVDIVGVISKADIASVRDGLTFGDTPTPEPNYDDPESLPQHTREKIERARAAAAADEERTAQALALLEEQEAEDAQAEVEEIALAASMGVEADDTGAVAQAILQLREQGLDDDAVIGAIARAHGFDPEEDDLRYYLREEQALLAHIQVGLALADQATVTYHERQVEEDANAFALQALETAATAATSAVDRILAAEGGGRFVGDRNALAARVLSGLEAQFGTGVVESLASSGQLADAVDGYIASQAALQRAEVDASFSHQLLAGDITVSGGLSYGGAPSAHERRLAEVSVRPENAVAHLARYQGHGPGTPLTRPGAARGVGAALKAETARQAENSKFIDQAVRASRAAEQARKAGAGR